MDFLVAALWVVAVSCSLVAAWNMSLVVWFLWLDYRDQIGPK